LDQFFGKKKTKLGRDSNPGPLAYESDVLPLHYRGLVIIIGRFLVKHSATVLSTKKIGPKNIIMEETKLQKNFMSPLSDTNSKMQFSIAFISLQYRQSALST